MVHDDGSGLNCFQVAGCFNTIMPDVAHEGNNAPFVSIVKCGSESLRTVTSALCVGMR